MPEPGHLRTFAKSDLVKGSWLNRQGCYILRRCTGEHSAAAILDQVRANDAVEVGEDGFWGFLMAAQRREFIDVLPAPADPTGVMITGTSDAYWPMHASIELTKRCNLRCLHCYADATPAPREELPTSDLIRLLENWSRKGLAGVELTGGEPLLHPGFEEIFDTCVDHFFTIAILTNGTLIDEAFVRRVSAYQGRIHIGTSVDGSTAERHDAIRGRGSFDKTTRGIRLLTDAGCAVRVGMTAAPYNVDDIKATGELAASLGAWNFSAAPVMPFGRGEEYARQFSDKDWAAIAQAVESLPKIACIREGTFDGRIQRMGNCGVGITNVILTPTGELKACLFLGEREQLGDLRNQSLDEVFTSERLRALSALRAPEPATCEQCAYEIYCRTCIARGMQIVNTTKRRCKWAQDYHLERAFPSYGAYPPLEQGIFKTADLRQAS
jgi:radical SAM protein with 4Fe4S-binding SPASM domain